MSTPRRILIVGLNYAPEPVGIGPYTTGLAQALAARGHRVAVVTGKPYYPQWRRDPAYQGGWRHESSNGVAIVRCPLYVPRHPGGLRRIAHLASFALSCLVPALRAQRPELVVAVAPALPSVASAWLAARWHRAPLWIHVQDFEVEAALATGLIGAGPFARLAGKVEAWLLRRGDRVSTISPQMCARLPGKGIAPDRILEIRNWADARFAADPAGAQRLREAWGLGGRKVVLYSGNIARKQGIEIVIEAARLLARRDDLAFVICGEGPNRAALEEQAAGLANVHLHDLVPAEDMGALLTLADIHVLPQIAGAADLVLPSKLTNMLASGRPVIATADPGTGLYAEVDGCGALVPPGDAPSLAKAAAQLADDPQRCADLGQAARKRAKERWEKEAIIDRFVTEADRLLG